MIKKICCFLCCTVILVLSCSTAFLSSAVVPDVYLPFPAPLEFGGPDCGAVVFHGVNSSNVDIYYMVVVIPNSYNVNGTFGGCDWMFTGTSNSFSVQVSNGANVCSGINVYLFSWKPTSGTFNCSLKSSFVLTESSNKTVSVLSNSSYTLDNFVPYGHHVGSSFSDTSIKPSYIFSGQVSQNDIDTIVAHCSGINSQLTAINSDLDNVLGGMADIYSEVNSINSATANIQSYAFAIANSNSAISSKLDSTNSWLSMISTDITIYSNEIIDKLNKLVELQGYEEPAETTTNSSVSELDKAEQALHKDSFEQLNSFEVPEFSSNAQSFGSGFVNAVQFLSSNMEFLSGNSSASSYNTETDDTIYNSMGKIATLIFVVLTIGLVSFVLNLVSSKGD